MRVLAKIIFRIVSADHLNTFDEQLHLIHATSLAEAKMKADKIGRDQQEWIASSEGSSVFWEYIGITELFELASGNNETMIYSFTTENSGEDYVNFVRERQYYIEQRVRHSPETTTVIEFKSKHQQHSMADAN